MYRKSVVSLLAAGLAFSMGTSAVHAKISPNTIAVSTEAKKDSGLPISADRMYNTIAFLSEQPREAGTQGEWRAVQYISKQFKALGYETKIQPYTFSAFEVDSVSAAINGSDMGEIPHAFTGTVNGNVTAQLVYVGKANPSEIGDVKGKIALVERGDLTFVDKVKNVMDRGAIGVIMFNNTGSSNEFGQVASGQNIPAVGITRAKGLELVERLKSETITANVKVTGAGLKEKTSYNVISSKKAMKSMDTGKTILIGAHHDSVHGGPGANDDASGVSGVLELAKLYAKIPTDTEIRFVTFGGEEKGLLGSYHYAQSLTPSDASRIVAHFQMDMIGGRDAGADHPLGGLIMYTIDGNKNLVTDLGTTASSQLYETIPYGKLGRSDHQPFHELGIPAALFIHSPVEPWYHTPEDTLDKIDKEKLKQTAEIVAASTFQIVRPGPNYNQNPVEYPFENRPVD
ncbi:M28 family peptidase [Fictibacillus enclensis]|uniref:M28 family peptidase n=1 Tax=Fictibacillus enclensis TaxID=1017270 RepID=UPI0024C09DFE|nr:M28 family peptidase [Fictibacillus enclensis]WHY70137.1 M28 family peptidase [Fictibacillus enclensis]